MTPKVVFALSIITAVAFCAWFMAFEFQAASWVLSGIGISATIAAIGVVATEWKKASQDQRE